MKKNVVVIGGGVIGIACAHYLLEAGHRVTLVEQSKIGSGCSHGNCGFVCPSHVLPLAEPGAIGRALKSLFTTNSPFRIKPRFNFALFSWLLSFARRCNKSNMLSAGKAIQPLLHSSMKLYEDLVSRGVVDCEWEKRGLLFAFRDAKAFEEYASTNELLANQFHEPARKILGPELRELEPGLAEGLAGGWYYEEDAHLKPDLLMSSWRNSLESLGLKIREGVSFVDFQVQSRRATTAKIAPNPVRDKRNLETLPADCFVIATGALTSQLGKAVGVRLPIEPGKGYSITMPSSAGNHLLPRTPLIFPETRVAVTPWASGLRIGSTMEFAGFDQSIPESRIKLLLDGSRPFLRSPIPEPIEERWFGWRPMTPDSIPYIGLAPRADNIFVAAGHNMLGLSMAPSTGKLISEMISEKPPHLLSDPYRILR